MKHKKKEIIRWKHLFAINWKQNEKKWRQRSDEKKSQIPFLFAILFSREFAIALLLVWTELRARREEVTAKEEKKLFESYKEKRNNSYIKKNFRNCGVDVWVDGTDALRGSLNIFLLRKLTSSAKMVKS